MDKNTAEIIKLGLGSGLLDLETVIQWADKKILENMNEVDMDLINVSTSKEVNKLISHLGKAAGSVEKTSFIEGYFAMLYHYYKNNGDDEQKIINALCTLEAEYSHLINDDDIDCIYTFEDDYSLALEGIYGNVNRIKADLKKFLSTYEDYRDDILP